MSQSKINKLCYFKLNPDGTYSRSATCQITYNKISTSGNDPSISQKMRYAQYIRNSSGRPKDNRPPSEIETVITKWRTDFFIDSSGNAFVSYILKHIPDYQFYNNSLLFNMYFERPGLETIGIFSFSNSNIQSIDFPNTLYSIGKNAFENCSLLTDINLSTYLTIIPEYTFYNCVKLTSVENISKIIIIEQYAFANCSELINFEFLESIQSIHNNVFENCTLLSNISFGEQIIFIGHSCFKNCSQLNNINLQNITDIQNNTFENCTSLSNIIFDNLLTNLGSSCFKNCTNLHYLHLPDSVITINERAFENSGLYDISFSNSLQTIGPYSFYNCNNLTNVKITSNVNTIHEHCFENCSNLTTLFINPVNNLENINDYAFYNCNNLNTISNMNNVINIGDYSFSNCFGLTSINIPDSTTFLGFNAFENCSFIDTVTIGSNLLHINPYTFNNCSYLNTININSNLLSINEGAFRNCSFLQNISIPYVTEIGRFAFESCFSLNNVDLSNILQIREKAFYNCRKLQSISKPLLLTFVGNNAFYNNRFKYFFFPNTLKTINQYAFNRCNLIEELEFDNSSVEIIQSYAFQNCSRLNHLLLPDSLQFINSFAFFNNTSLKEVYLRQPVADNLNISHGFNLPFYGATSNITIIDDLQKPLHITHQDIIINGERAVLNEVYLYFNNDVSLLLANKVSINITEGSIINDNSDYPTYFTIDGNTPMYVPTKYNNFNNLNNQIWFRDQTFVPSNTYFKIAQFVTTRKTFGNLHYTYSDNTRNDYLEYNLKFIYGKLLNYKYIAPTVSLTYTNVSLPLIIEYDNVIIDSISYVVNRIYLSFPTSNIIYSHTINTNIIGNVYLDENDLDKSTYFTIDNNKPFLIPSTITDWNNLKNQIWFYPNYKSIPNSKFMIMQFTLTSNSDGNFNYIYSDITKNDYENYLLTVTNGYIGGFD